MISLEEGSVGILSRRSDYTRVVRPKVPKDVTHIAEEIVPAAPAKLTYRNGPLLDAVEVFTIFWGDDWTKDPLKEMVKGLNQFFNDILTSSLMDQIAEYNVPSMGYNIGHGKFIGSITITQLSPTRTVTDGVIQHILRQELTTNNDIPKPTQNTLYFLYLPPRVAVSALGDRSCQGFCGYHDHIDGTQIYYATMPYPSCNGCLGSLDAFGALTSNSSHMLVEAITDPIPGQGWYDDNNGEIGDMCSWQTKQIDGYSIQLEWSNKKKHVYDIKLYLFYLFMIKALYSCSTGKHNVSSQLCLFPTISF